MLSKTVFLSTEEEKKIIEILQEIKKDAKAGNFTIENDFEDIHSKIESILIEKLGETGKKIHTARSRNDQILNSNGKRQNTQMQIRQQNLRSCEDDMESDQNLDEDEFEDVNDEDDPFQADENTDLMDKNLHT